MAKEEAIQRVDAFFNEFPDYNYLEAFFQNLIMQSSGDAAQVIFLVDDEARKLGYAWNPTARSYVKVAEEAGVTDK